MPLDFDLPSSNADIDFSSASFRDKAKTQIIDTILDKNGCIKDMVANGSTLEVVYIQRHRHSCTVAIKVTPDIRKFIIDSCNSKLYVFSCRCKVEDRYYIKQCFHCQQFGHMANNCPDKERSPVCMYCCGDHRSSNCPSKSIFTQHKCSNCLKSDDPNISAKASTHNSGSYLCPVATAIVTRIQKRTQLSVSKNE